MNKKEQLLAIIIGFILCSIFLSLGDSLLSVLFNFSTILACPFLFILGLRCLFGDVEVKKFGLKLIAISLVGFLVGMSICSQTRIN